jgi:hypothetical protein
LVFGPAGLPHDFADGLAIVYRTRHLLLDSTIFRQPADEPLTVVGLIDRLSSGTAAARSSRRAP